MKKQKSFFKTILFITLFGGLFVLNNFALAGTVNHVVISEIQIIGATSKDEFVELYNPTSNQIDLSGWKLTKKTSSGSESNLLTSFPDKSIPAHGYFLIVHKTDYQGITISDVTFSGNSYSVASNNTVILYGLENQVIDKVGFGSANDFEGATVANPSAGKSIERKPGGEQGNGDDTDNNFNDFWIQTLPNPQNSSSPIQPPVEEPPDQEPPPEQPPADTTAPDEVSDLTATAGDAIVDLTWTASASEDVAGYKLYINSGSGFDNGIDLGQVATKQVVGLTNGTLYTFKITAYDEVPNESSGVVVQTTPTAPPLPEEPSSEPLQGTTALPGEVIISEIMWDGSEYLELYNTTSADIILTDWTIADDDGIIYTFIANDKIEAGGYFLIEDASDCTSVAENVVAPITLNNTDGELIILKDSTGTIIDSANQVTGGWLAGANTETGDSMERKSPPGDGTKAENWQTSIGRIGNRVGTPGQANSSGVLEEPDELEESDEPDEPDEPDEQDEIEEEPQQESEALTPISSAGGGVKSYSVGTIVINEFVPDPADGEVEWIELYLTTDEIIDLSNWTIEDGSEAITKLSDTIGFTATIPRFKVIEKPKGNLNNRGDAIFLKDPAGKIINQVIYGDWNDGEISDNAPTVKNPYGIARKKDGVDTDNNFNDFLITSSLTKGKPNIITAPGGAMKDILAPIIPADVKIIINEILPNPRGPDNQKEFIELKNIGEKTINLVGWRLADNSASQYVISKKDFKNTEIKPDEFFVLDREKTGIALNNTGGDSVKLFLPGSKIPVETINYRGKVEESQSFSRLNNDWHWSTKPTPGKENIISQPNQAPKAVIEAEPLGVVGQEIYFDASDSYDPDGNVLSYQWNFGSGGKSDLINPVWIFNKSGDYSVGLVVTDSNGAKGRAEVKIKIFDSESLIISSDGAGEFLTIDQTVILPNIFISEFLPNPPGSDGSGEWIEIFNADQMAVDLVNWKLDDEQGGSRPYLIAKSLVIPSGEYLVFERVVTKLALNNTGDSVRLIAPDSRVVFEIEYGKAEEGLAYTRDQDGEWQWTASPTPGETNIIVTPVLTEKKTVSKLKPVFSVSLDKVREQDKGDRVRIKGTVAVEPGVLGKTVFYLAGSGIQIHMAKQDWPDIKLGDYIEVTGTLSESNDEMRINVQDKSNFIILEHQEPPQPHSIKIGDINEEKEGNLVTVSGEIIDKKGNNIYIDDGSDEIRLYIKSSTNIDTSKINTGDQAVVTGIISQTKSGYRLLSRYSDDIKVIHLSVAGASQIDGGRELIIPSYDARKEIMRYLLVAVVALSIILIGLLKKYNNERQSQAAAPETVISEPFAEEVEVIALPPPKIVKN